MQNHTWCLIGMYIVGSLFTFVITFRFLLFHEKEEIFATIIGSSLAALFWIALWPTVAIIKTWEIWIGPLKKHMKTFKWKRLSELED